MIGTNKQYQAAQSSYDNQSPEHDDTPSILDFFDSENPAHLEFYAEFKRNGYWHSDFPQNLYFPPYWQTTLDKRLADRWTSHRAPGLDEVSRNIILYSMGYYKFTEPSLDLHFLMLRLGRPSDADSIWNALVAALRFAGPSASAELLSKIFRFRPTLDEKAAFSMILNKLTTIKVFDGDFLALDLGQPDPKILPINQPSK